jgi:pimeloyl-[acyl-carrier protein] methyl ester esterase
MALTLYHDIYQCTGVASGDDALEMVLVHGWGLHSVVWDNIMPALLKKFKVTVVDLPGFGRSPVPGGEYDLNYLTEHVLAVAPKNAIWLGWSLGGMIALNVSIRFPERVRGLVNVATTPRFIASERWPMALDAKVLSHFRALLLEDWEGTLIRFLALQCKDSTTIKEDVRFLKEIVFFHGQPSTKALRCGLDVLKNVDLIDNLSGIQVPTLYVLGEKDNLVPVGISRELKKLQPNAKIAVIKGASHVPFISDQGTFLAAVDDFLMEHHFA